MSGLTSTCLGGSQQDRRTSKSQRRTNQDACTYASLWLLNGLGRAALSPTRTETTCCRRSVKRSARNVTQSHMHGHRMPVRHSCVSVRGRLQNSFVRTGVQKKAAARFPGLQLARSLCFFLVSHRRTTAAPPLGSVTLLKLY